MLLTKVSKRRYEPEHSVEFPFCFDIKCAALLPLVGRDDFPNVTVNFEYFLIIVSN